MSIQTVVPHEARLAVALFAGLGLVLFVMAAVLTGFAWSGTGATTAGCGQADTSMGECLTMSKQHQIQLDLLFDMGLSLAAGAVASIGAAVASFLLLRPARALGTAPLSNG